MIHVAIIVDAFKFSTSPFFIAFTVEPTIDFDDGGLSRGIDSRPFGWTQTATPMVADVDLVVRGTSVVVLTAPLEVNDIATRRPGEIDTLPVLGGATDELSGMSISARNLVIGSEAAIDLNERGYRGDCATGDLNCGNGGHGEGNANGSGGTRFNAGSHGGPGGGDPKPTYGDPLAPTTFGAGGGYGNSGSENGGHGGGRFEISGSGIQ